MAALPALHLPAHRKPAKKKAAAKAKKAPRVSTPPRAGPTAVPTATAPRVSTPPVSAEAPVAQQDLRHLGMIGRRADGRERPSLRWIAVGVAVALAAAIGGWFLANHIAADPASAPRSRRSSTPVRRA